MNICLIQTDPENGQHNLAVAAEVVRRHSADLYVFPELFTVGFRRATAEPWKYAEPLGGSMASTIREALVLRPRGTVIAGLLERDGNTYCNTAIVVQRQSLAAYRQKNPTAGLGKCFTPGTFATFFIGCEQFGFRCRIGLMICSDYFMANEFLTHYKEQRVDLVIMIAESAGTRWRRDFPRLCRESSIPAIVCNAAGDKMGGSCGWSAAGNSLSICAPGSGEC